MLKKVTNKKLFLCLALTLMMSMLIGIGLASAATGGLDVSCAPASADADGNQAAGDISIQLDSAYADSVGESGRILAEITLPRETVFTEGASVSVDAGTIAGQTPNEIRVRLGSADSALEVSNISLDIAPGFNGPVVADIRVWGLDSAGAQVFSLADSITIAEVESPIVSTVDKTIVSIQVATVVNIPDTNLQAAVRSALGKPSGDITTDDMATLTSLTATNANIVDLTGLETAINLTALDLQLNTIVTINPLANLAKLQTLDLRGNRVSTLPNMDNMIGLTWIRLNENSISDITPLTNLAGLQTIYLYGNDITTLPTLNKLTSLKFIDLEYNQISDLTNLASLSSLEELRLGNNQISNISPLTGMTSLKVLWLYENNISNVPSLANLDALQTLFLFDNQITSVAGINGLASLTWLDLSENPGINVAGFSNLPTLWILDLANNNISDITGLGNLPSLKRLYLNNNNISNISALASCTVVWNLNLSDNNISNIGTLNGLGDLEEVYLSNNQIADISSLANKAYLRILDLAYNEITAITALSTGVPALTNVDVTYNNLDISQGSAALNIINTLIGKGVTVYYYPQNYAATYTVTYNGNSSTGGTVPVDSNSYSQVDTVTVLRNTGSLVKTGYTFGGWNTAANGSGTTYAPGDTFTMGPANRILYAKWVSGNVLIEDFVTRFYQLCLSREPDAGGLAYWVNALVAQQETGASIAQNFIFSDEFINRGVSDSTYLDIMYQTFFNRAADSGGKAYWQEQLNNGMSRMYILASFVNSDEFNTVCTTYGITRGSITLTDPADLHPQITAFVNRFYVECLERTGDSAGLNYWVDQLVTGARAGADVANGFIGSPEFQARSLTNEQYLTILYTAFFNRAADTAGWDYWIAQLTAGTSRMEALGGFIYAPEFGDLCAAYGIRQM